MKMKHTEEKAIKCTLCKTAFCCNFNLTENKERKIQGGKHLSADSAKLLFVVF